MKQDDNNKSLLHWIIKLHFCQKKNRNIEKIEKQIIKHGDKKYKEIERNKKRKTSTRGNKIKIYNTTMICIRS